MFFPASGFTRSAWPALGISKQSLSAKPIQGAGKSFHGFSQDRQYMTISERFPSFQRTLFLEDHPAKEPASAPQSAASALDFLYGPTCYAPGSTPELNGLSWSSRPETRLGKPKSRDTFAALATTSPDLSSALRTLVHLIRDGECTLLPAPVCRDWRSPGPGPQAIERAKRAALARGDWHPDSIPTFDLDTWRSEDVFERREAIEALGDSNPPAMAEVIGYMLMAAKTRTQPGISHQKTRTQPGIVAMEQHQ